MLYLLFGFIRVAMPKLAILGLGFFALVVRLIALAARRMHDTDLQSISGDHQRHRWL